MRKQINFLNLAHKIIALQKILLIRFSSIGDIVLTSPVIRCLKQQADVSLHFLCKRNYRSILEANPYIDKVYSIDQSVSEVASELKNESYDLIIDLHKNIRSAQVCRALGIKSYSFNKINLQKWLMVNFKINRLPDVHIVDRYLQAVAPLGIKNDGQGLDFFIPDDVQVDLPSGQLAFAIGAAHATKRLPVEKIIAICKESPRPVILLGGPQERATGELITAAAPKVINTCGQLSLHQSARVIEQSKQIITHDTGMMHIAAALRKPIISIWGNTIPDFGMYPYYPEGLNLNKTIEVKNLSCRPCSKIGYGQCPKGHFRCMAEVDVVEVVRVIL